LPVNVAVSLDPRGWRGSARWLYHEQLTRREQICAAVLLLGVALISTG
jgi:hypothetical protein